MGPHGQAAWPQVAVALVQLCPGWEGRRWLSGGKEVRGDGNFFSGNFMFSMKQTARVSTDGKS